MGLTRQAADAFKWSILGEAASRLITPLVFLALARLLLPEDFGVVAAATVVISFSQTLAEAGLAKALIQRQDDVNECANVVFWLNLVFACFIMALLLVAAPAIATFFHDARISDVIRLLSLQILFSALCSVHTALLQKELRFKKLFWVRFLTAGAPALAAVPLALNGMGYWALVVGTLFGQAMQAAVLWAQNDWRPHWNLNTALATQLIQFGKWAMLSGLLGWLYSWLDAIIVGHYLGSHDMGLYRTSNALVIMLFGLILAPLLPVLYSLFSRRSGDIPGVSDALLKSARYIIAISLPMAAIVVIFSKTIESHLFGSAWSGMAPLIALLAVGQGFAWIVGANGEAYRSIGKPSYETWAIGISIFAYLVGYLISIQHGLIAFAATRAALVLVGIFTQVLFAKRSLYLQPSSWILVLYKPALFTLAGFGVAFGMGGFQHGAIGLATVQAITTIAVYLVLSIIFDKELFTSLLATKQDMKP